MVLRFFLFVIRLSVVTLVCCTCPVSLHFCAQNLVGHVASVL